jgi:hypothetical protein
MRVQQSRVQKRRGETTRRSPGRMPQMMRKRISENKTLAMTRTRMPQMIRARIGMWAATRPRFEAREEVHPAFTRKIVCLIPTQVTIQRLSHAKDADRHHAERVLCERGVCSNHADDSEGKGTGGAAECRVDRVFQAGRCEGSPRQAPPDVPCQLHQGHEEEDLRPHMRRGGQGTEVEHTDLKRGVQAKWARGGSRM